VVREASLHNGIIAYGNGAKFERMIAPHDETLARILKKVNFLRIDRVNLKQSVVKSILRFCQFSVGFEIFE
jgi:hypothetical protein